MAIFVSFVYHAIRSQEIYIEKTLQSQDGVQCYSIKAVARAESGADYLCK